MPELRKDPVIGRWVIIATERAKRPHDFQTSAEPSREGGCPFCEGSEDMTPPEVYAIREPGLPSNAPGWRVRVVPNLYPVLQVEGDLEKRAYGMYDRMHGIGAHEVIVETPRHLASFTPLPDRQVAEVLLVYRERLLDLQKDRRLAYGMLFKNVGKAAGASLEHTHSQLIVTPVVPRRVTEELAGAQRHFDYRGRCVFCDIVYQELGMEERIVMATDRFLAIAPYASRFPFETWILPRDHGSHFESLTAPDAEDLAFLLNRVLGRIERALDRPAYNFMVHTAPFHAGEMASYHWHIEIIPRVTRTAGFEWGTGFYINPVPPESAAEYLRKTPDEVFDPAAES
jgi:UDPglucose--hexose-1-phosphate uridylyltransferase